MHNYNKPGRYALGMFGLSAIIFMVTTYSTYFYNVHAGLSMQAIAAANIIITIWGTFVNPVAGYLSDRTRTKIGRRKPWVYLFVPLLMMANFMLFSPPSLGSGFAMAVYFTTLMVLIETTHGTSFLNYNALLPEIFRDVKLRNQANAIRQSLQFVGMLISVSLVPLIAIALGYYITAIILSLVGGGFTLYSVKGCKERDEFISSAPPPLIGTIKTLASSWNFWCVSLSFFFYQVSLGLILSGIPFFIRFTLNEHEGMASVLSAAIFAFAIPAMFMWYKLINRLGAVRSWRLALAWLGLSLLPLVFINNLILASAAAIFIGMGISGVAANLDMVHSQLVDEDASESGLRREASFFAGISFVARMSGIVRSGVLFLLFFIFAFESADNPGLVPDMAARFMMVVFPAVFMGFAWVCAVLARFRGIKK